MEPKYVELNPSWFVKVGLNIRWSWRLLLKSMDELLTENSIIMLLMISTQMLLKIVGSSIFPHRKNLPTWWLNLSSAPRGL